MAERWTRERRLEHTRSVLLDAAEEVFAEKGFTPATLDDIARTAGYTKGAIYKHFATKEDLFLAVSDRYWRRYFDNFAEVMASASRVGAHELDEIAERWRMQPLGSDRVRIINDAYNASPDSMSAALRTLAQIAEPGQRKVAVLGAMSELGEYAGEEHDRVGLLAVRLRIERIVVVGRDARRLYLAAVGEGSWDGEAVFFETADEAFDYLSGELRDGDRVLVKSSNSAGLRHLGDRLGESFS